MKLNNNKIVISAAYGMGNIGDEAICETIVKELCAISSDINITILVFDEKIFIKTHPDFICNKNLKIRSMNFRKNILFKPKLLLSLFRGIVSIFFCDLFIWGGGNLIRNRKYWLNIYIKPLLFAQIFGKKIIIWSIGVDKISKPEVINLVNKIRKTNLFSVRDHASMDNILDISKYYNQKDVKVIRDPVFCFTLFKKNKNICHKKRIGFNITFWKADFSNTVKIEDFVISFAKILNDLNKNLDVEFVYLPTASERDSFVYKLLLKKIDTDMNLIYPNISTPNQFIDHVSKLDLFVGMRMHSIILASCVEELPILGIIYDEKVQTLSDECGLENMLVSIDDIIKKPDNIREKILNILDGETKSINFSKIRQNSAKMVKYIKSYL